MGRLAQGTRTRRTVPGVGALVMRRHRMMDGAFCLAPFREECWWCNTIAALNAGQPVQLIGDDIYSALCVDEYLARTCRDLLHDRSVYEVRADTLELLNLAGLASSPAEPIRRKKEQSWRL